MVVDVQSMIYNIHRVVYVKNLNVIDNGDSIELHGLCSSYYFKQLAGHTALCMAGSLQVCNLIQVLKMH